MQFTSFLKAIRPLFFIFLSTAMFAQKKALTIRYMTTGKVSKTFL